MTAGSAGGTSRRPFIIEFFAKISGFVSNVGVINQSLGNVSRSFANTSRSAATLGVANARYASTMGGAAYALSRSWTRTAIIVGGVYIALKKIVGETIMAASSLDKTLDLYGKTIDITDQKTGKLITSSDRLANRFLRAGRDARALTLVTLELRKAGVRSEEQLFNMSMATWKLSKIMGTSAVDMSKSLAQFQAQMGLSEERMLSLMATMAALKMKMGISNEAILGLSTSARGQAVAMGVSESSLLKMTAVYEKLGIHGSAAGSATSELMSTLTDPTRAAMLGAFHVNVNKLQASLRSGDMVGVLGELQKVGESKQPWWVKERILGLSPDQLTALQQLPGRYSEISESLKDVESQYDSMTFLTELFDQATSNLHSQLEILWESFGAVRTLLGQLSALVLWPIVKVLNVLISVIAKVPLLGVVGAMGLLAVGTLAAVAAFVWIVTTVWKFFVSLNMLNLALSRYLAQQGIATTATMAGTAANTQAALSNTALAGSTSMLTKVKGALTVARVADFRIALAEYVHGARMLLQDIMRSSVVKKNIVLSGMLQAVTMALVGAETLLTTWKKKGLVLAITESAQKVRNIFLAKMEALAVKSAAVNTMMHGNATKMMSFALLKNQVALILNTAWTYACSAAHKVATFARSLLTVALWAGIGAKLRDIAVNTWLIVSTYAVAFAKGVATAAQWALNLAMYAFPGTWLVLVIVAVVGVLALLVKQVGWVEAALIALGIAFLFLPGIGPIIGVLTLALYGLYKLFVLIKSYIFGSSFLHIGEGLMFLLGPIGWVILAFKNMGKILTFLKGLFASIKDAAAHAFRWVIEHVKAAFSWIVSIASKAIGWLKSAFAKVGPIFMMISPIGWIILAFKNIGKIFEFLKGSLAFLGRVIAWSLIRPFSMFGQIVKWVISGISSSFSWILGILDKIIGLFSKVNNAIVSAGKAVLDNLLGPFRLVADAASVVKGKLFGSGLFHIDEGAASARRSTQTLTDSIMGVARSARHATSAAASMASALSSVSSEVGSIGLGMENLNGKTVGAVEVVRKIDRRALTAIDTLPMGREASLARAAGVVSPAARMPVVNLSTPVMSGGKKAELTVNVPLYLEGEQIAQAMAKIDLDEVVRGHGAPNLPMRGIPR